MISGITFVTGNHSKFDDAVKLFQNTGIEVSMEEHGAPEIQAERSAEVSAFSANYLKDTLNKPFFVMDRSFHIASLKGFPGPYIKYVNNWMASDKILTLLKNETNRKAWWETSISCFIPTKQIVTFTGINNGTVSEESYKGKGWVIDEIFVPEQSNKTLSLYSQEESTNFWNANSCWEELIHYLQTS